MSRIAKFACASLLGTIGLASAAWTQERPPAAAKKPRPTTKETKVNDVAGPMQLKLKYVQRVLEGVAVEDFDEIAENAQTLGLLAQDENWQVYQTVEYRQHSVDFQHRADELVKAAKRKNIDGAALAYLELTMCCVNCHKHTRSIQDTREVTRSS